jgi:hypothetical protein
MEKSTSQQIDEIIRQHAGWKGDLITQLRNVILQTNPAIIEEVKWKMPSRPEGIPVWSYNGILCIAEIFKNDVKLTFFKGAFMKDPKKLFNARLKSPKDRAIAFHEGDTVDRAELRELVQEAIKLNSK